MKVKYLLHNPAGEYVLDGMWLVCLLFYFSAPLFWSLSHT